MSAPFSAEAAQLLEGRDRLREACAAVAARGALESDIEELHVAARALLRRLDRHGFFYAALRDTFPPKRALWDAFRALPWRARLSIARCYLTLYGNEAGRAVVKLVLWPLACLTPPLLAAIWLARVVGVL